MRNRNRLAAAAAVFAAAVAGAPAAAVDVEVTHWWTSAGSSAAARVFADSFDALGGDRWVDGAIGGGGGVALPIIVTRITGGDPMGATQLNHGRQAEELVEAGLMLDLTDVAERENWRSFVRPPSLLESCEYDGRIYCVPVNIHSWQWMWISPPAFKKAGAAVPRNWDEFVAAAPKLREAGIVPLALGTQPWQFNGMFNVILVGLGGVDLWKAINVDLDAEVAAGPEMRAVWEAFADARKLSVGSNVASWNEATNLVITARAGAQIMGDWAQSEFTVAGQTAGKEYDCLPGLGIKGVLSTDGDAFYFPKTDDEELIRAQKKMASMLLSKKVQVDFNLIKGSLPVRADVDLDAANECMKRGLAILDNPDGILPAESQVLSPDTAGQVQDLLIQFWNDQSISAADAQEAYTGIIATAD